VFGSCLFGLLFFLGWFLNSHHSLGKTADDGRAIKAAANELKGLMAYANLAQRPVNKKILHFPLMV
jgi:hypothetical protein